MQTQESHPVDVLDLIKKAARESACIADAKLFLVEQLRHVQEGTPGGLDPAYFGWWLHSGLEAFQASWKGVLDLDAMNEMRFDDFADGDIAWENFVEWTFKPALTLGCVGANARGYRNASVIDHAAMLIEKILDHETGPEELLGHVAQMVIDIGAKDHGKRIADEIMAMAIVTPNPDMEPDESDGQTQTVDSAP